MENGSPENINPNWPVEEKNGPQDIARSFMEKIGPYVNGREFRTETFNNLPLNPTSHLGGQADLYIKLNGVIGKFSYDQRNDILNWLGNKIFLVGEPGISYQDGRLNIGPGADREQIESLILEKFAEETKSVGQNIEPEQNLNMQEKPEEPQFREENESEAELYKRLRRKDEQPRSKWSEMSDLLSELDIDFEFNEEHLKKFEETNPNAEGKYNEIREAIESFPNKDGLKGKFSTIRLGYPRYEQNSKIFIENGVLYVDLGISKQEITDFLQKNIPSAPVAPESSLVPEPEPIADVPVAQEKLVAENVEIGGHQFDRNSPVNVMVDGGAMESDWFILDVDNKGVSLRKNMADGTPLMRHVSVEKFLASNGVSAPENPENPEEKPESEEKSEIIEGINIDTTLYDKSKSDENYDVKTEIDRALQDLNEEEKELLKSNNLTIAIKDESVLFPTYYEDTKTLNVGFGSTREDVILAIRKTVIPSMQPALDQTQNEKPEQTIPVVNVAEQKPTPTPEPKTEAEKIPEWKESEEWKKFELMRDDLARYETPISQLGMSSIGLELKRSEYRSYKETIAKKIAESLRKEAGENLTPEQEAELKRKIHDTANKELLDKEQESYKKALQEHRSETLADKTMEVLRSARKTRVGKWYLGLSREKRMALNFVLGTAVGIGLGAASSVGVLSYTGMRLARVGASFGGATVGTVIGEKKKSLSLEDLDKKEQEETEALKNSDKSWEEKSKEFEDIKDKYEKEKNKIKLKKTAWAVGLGAGAGILTGLTEQVIGRPNLEPPHAPKPPAPPESIAPKPTEPVIIRTERFFSDPSVLVQEAKGGDGVWKMLNRALENAEKFKNLGGTGTAKEIADQIEAKQTRVLQSLVGEVLKNHDKYGVGPNGEIAIGQKIDFSELFKNSDKFNEILKDAETLKPATIASIVENNDKIEGWIKENPGKKVDVDEILKYKPKTKISAGDIYGDEAGTTEIASNDTYTEGGESGMSDQEIAKNLEPTEPPAPEVEEPPKLAPTAPEELVKPKTAIQETLENEIIEAKKRIESLHGENMEEGGSKDGLRTMSEDVALVQEVDKIFKENIDEIYGTRKWFRKIEGINSTEWKFMKGLPANKVIEYFRDPENSTLPKNILKELGTSEKHRGLVERVTGWIGDAHSKAQVDFKPFDNGETMEAFIKRLGTFLMKK